jgi:hypothetical protein
MSMLSPSVPRVITPSVCPLPSALGPGLRQSARELLERTRDDQGGGGRCEDDWARRSPPALARADSRSDSDGDTESRCTSSSPPPREAQQHIQIPQPRKSYPTIDKALVPPLNLHRLAPPFPPSEAVQAAHPTQAGRDVACEDDDADVEQVYFEARIPACYVLQRSCHLLCEGLQADIRFCDEGTAGENGGEVVVAARKVDAPLSAAERAALRQVGARAYTRTHTHTHIRARAPHAHTLLFFDATKTFKGAREREKKEAGADAAAHQC